MKKYIISILIASIFTAGTSFAVSVPPVSAAGQPMTISQFIELLITIGVVTPDKVAAARAFASQLSASSTSATTTAIKPVNSTPYVQVLAPNGGEKWMIDLDVPYTISWGASAQMPVNIAFVPTKGSPCTITSLPVSSVNGDNKYDVLLKIAKCYNQKTGTSTPLLDGTYKVRVSSANTTGVITTDDSSSTMTILPPATPTIKVTYPNGGEKLISGNYYDIKYTLKNTDDRGMMITLVDYQGNTAYSLGVFGFKGLYHFHVPYSINPGAYKIELDMSTVNGDKISDTSDNFFWISGN